MTEGTEVKKRGRGRPPADPNAPKKEKKAPGGRKYFVRVAEEWEQFIANQPTYQSMDAASAAAEEMIEKATEEGNPTLRVALFEEAGFMQAEVQKKVVRNFTPSRTHVGRAKASGATAEPGASGEASPPEAPSTLESTHSSGRRSGRHRE